MRHTQQGREETDNVQQCSERSFRSIKLGHEVAELEIGTKSGRGTLLLLLLLFLIAKYSVAAG
jgi:hypothetical protein